MISKLKKLTDGLIVFSVLVSDYEKLDFKNDALAGVRANYFNSNESTQSEKTEVVFDDKVYNLSYLMLKNEPLSWKITRNNQPYQTVKRATGGIYCVIVYGENGIINKRQYFDDKHNWIRTEYYDKNFENVLVAILYPTIICGITALRFEQIDVKGKKKIKDLFPSDKNPKTKCAGLVYSNCGMIWYDESFAPEGIEKVNNSSEEKSTGFAFQPENFSDLSVANITFDLLNAEYLEEVEPENITEEIKTTDNNKNYSAYDKIEKILTEAHKSNKDLFGEILTQTLNADFDKIDEVNLSDENEIVENNTSENKYVTSDESVVIDSPKDLEENYENSDFTEKTDETSFDECENPACDVVIHTKTGRYSYYGEVDSNNCRIGRGRTVTPQGITSYDGEYKEDKRHGFGVCYYKEGNINYVGNWDNGNRCGCGVGYRLSDGTMHAGKWNSNSPDGFGARFDSEGNFIDVCCYSNGVRNGKSISFDENGNVVIKKWMDGELISEQVIEEEE